MAHLLFRKDPSPVCVVDIFDELPVDFSLPSDKFVLVEYDYNPEVDCLECFELSGDETSVINPYAGKSLDEQRSLFYEDQKNKVLQREIELKIQSIKLQAKEKIEELGWKVERAKERDLLNGNNDAMTEVAAEREAIRQASNEHELKLLALTTLEEVENFDLKF